MWRNYHDSFFDENRDLHDNNNQDILLIAKETDNKIKRVINALLEQCRDEILMRLPLLFF